MNTRAATILIVDDEIKNCRLLEALLRPEGYQTVSVASGEDALAAVALNPPDLILLDVMMPGMDGFQVTRTLKADAATASIPIIMVTAHIERSARLEGLEAGAEEFLTKPIDRAELWLRVRNLLRLKSLGDYAQDHDGQPEPTVQQRSEDLRELHTRFSGFVESSPMLAWVYDQDGHCLYANKTWSDMLGIDPRHEFGNTRIGVERTALFAKLRRGQQEVLATGEVVQRPLWIPELDGTFRCWDSVKFPIREASGRMVVGGIGIDITKQKLAEMEVLNLNACMEQKVIERTAELETARVKADRASQDRSASIGAMGEQIRIPLHSVIQLISDLHESSLDAGQRQLVDSARLSADALQDILEEILSLSAATPRQQAGAE